MYWDILKRIFRRPFLWIKRSHPQQMTSTKSIEKIYLTRRQKEILRMFGQNKSIEQIAEELHLSEYTIMDHTKSIRRKFNVGRTSLAYEEAMKRKML